MKITKEIINKGITAKGFISSVQFNILGVSYPPIKNWKTMIIGKDVELDKINEYISLKGLSGIEASKKIAKRKREDKLNNLDKTIFQRPIQEEIKESIKHKTINFDGLVILNSFLEKIQLGQTLSEGEISILKKIDILYKDIEKVAIKNSYVYLAYMNTDYKGNSIVKIGYSKNPKKRIEDLKTGNPNIVLLTYATGSMNTEKILHNMFLKNIFNGEWFSFHMQKEEVIDMFKNAVDRATARRKPLIGYRNEMLRKWKIT